MKTTLVTSCILLMLISSLLLVDGGAMAKRLPPRASKKVIVEPLFSLFSFIVGLFWLLRTFHYIYHTQAIHELDSLVLSTGLIM